MNTFSDQFPEIQHIRMIPGFGPVSSPSFVGLIMDPCRFSHRQKLWTYCRMGLRSAESGGEKIRKDRLDNWNGHGVLKDISRKAYIVARQTENIFNKYYLKKRIVMEEHKARLATQRKILTTAWQIWLKKEEFVPDHVI